MPLWEVERPPREIFAEGSDRALLLLNSLPENGFAIVGTREPQAISMRLVERWVALLQDSGLIILSGLARGIDAAAHESALKAGIPTIAILGGGLDIPYPRENLSLRKRILDSDGLIVTEFPEGTQPQAGFFIQRNRLIAGWAKATWVVEAGKRSGALNTASWAMKMHRTCFATPCFPGDSIYEGNRRLFDDEAVPLWKPHYLSSVWDRLLALDENRRPQRASRNGSSDEHLLGLEIEKMTSAQGGIQIPEALDWAIRQGWSPARFFSALQIGLQKQLISERSGVLISG